MGDLFDQARILAVMYISSYECDRDPTKLPMSYNVLRTEKYFKAMDDVGRLSPMLVYLHDTGYIEADRFSLSLSGKGLSTTRDLYRKFLDFIKKITQIAFLLG
jgi:hypothetical protein